MVKTLAILILSLVAANAQLATVTNYPAPNAVYLWVRNYTNAVTALTKMDTALGYPNPPTKTDRAIDWQLLSNGTNALIRIDLHDVYSPRFDRYVNLAARLKEQVSDTQWGTEVCSNATQLVGKPVARVTGLLAKQIGYILTRTNTIVTNKVVIK